MYRLDNRKINSTLIPTTLLGKISKSYTLNVLTRKTITIFISFIQDICIGLWNTTTRACFNVCCHPCLHWFGNTVNSFDCSRCLFDYQTNEKLLNGCVCRRTFTCFHSMKNQSSMNQPYRMSHSQVCPPHRTPILKISLLTTTNYLPLSSQPIHIFVVYNTNQMIHKIYLKTNFTFLSILKEIH